MNAFSPVTGLTVAAMDVRDRAASARADDFVRAHPLGSLFHRPQWSRMVERGCRQRAHYLVAERGGKLVGCLPLVAIRSILFGNAMVSTGFGTGGGILAADEAAVSALAEASWSLARGEGFASVELRGGPIPSGWCEQKGVHANFDRALPADRETLLASLPRRQRAEVRKALGFALDVTIGTDRRHRDAFFRVYGESVRNLGTPVFPRALFEAALDEFDDDASVVAIWREGEPLAAFLNLRFGSVLHTYWGGGTADARRWRANDLAYFETMRHAIHLGCERADFGRSKVGSGPWQRKRIWDFDETPLVYGVRTAAGTMPREINPASSRYRFQVAAWSRMPLFLANRMGPVIARGLG